MDWSQLTIRRIRGLIVFTIAILVGLWKFDVVLDAMGFVWGIIFPFVLGSAIAFIINVPMSFIERKFFGEKKKKSKIIKKLARPMSLIFTIALAVGVVVLIMFGLIPQLADTFTSLGSNISAFIPQLKEWIGEVTNNNQDILKWMNQLEFNPDKMLQWGMNIFNVGAGNVMNITVAAVGGIISGIATFFIAFSFACYILVQKEKLHVQVRKAAFAFVPKRKAEVILEVCSLTYKTFASFLAGQCVEAVILGCMFVITMMFLQMPYALLIGVIITFTALVPIFGAFIGCVLGVFMIFMINPKQALVFVILFLVLQQIEGNLIYPHVVGNSVGLPSIWVLAAVTVGGKLMGITGMVIFIPIASVLYALFRELVYLELKRHRIKRVTADAVEEYTSKEVERMQEIYRAEHAEEEE